MFPPVHARSALTDIWRGGTLMISEQQRLEMHRGLVAALGEEVAGTLMEHLPPVGWADVARRSDLDHLATTLRLEMQAMESRFEAKLVTEISHVRVDLDARFDATRRDTRNYFIATLMAVFAAVGGSLGGVAALTH